jgi:multidrug efflux system outer membrane protein
MKAQRFKQIALVALMGAGLAGCSLAPKYKRPEQPVAASWPDRPTVQFGEYEVPATPAQSSDIVIAPKSGTAAADLGWHDFFRDPRLQKLIELALIDNRDLRIAVQRVEEARAQYGIERAQQWPSIAVGSQGTRQHLPPDLRPQGPDGPAISTQYNAGLSLLTFEIDLFGRLRSLSEAALHQYLATAQARKAVQLTLVGAVAQSYFNLRAAEVQLDLTQKTLASRQASYNLVKIRFDSGVASELDLAQAKSVLDSAAADLAQLTRLQAQATNALVLLIGSPLPADLPPPTLFGADQLLASVPPGLPSDLLTRRPDILAAEHQLQAANANIGAARAAFFPTLSLTGLLGSASTELGNLFKSGQGYWSFSPTIATPLFAGGQLRESLNVAKVRENIAVAQYEKTIQQAFREVADALAGEATYGAQLDALRALHAASARALELAELRYKNGVDSYLQVQNAQVNYLNAGLGLVRTGLAALNNRVDLYKALGGGWSETTKSQ